MKVTTAPPAARTLSAATTTARPKSIVLGELSAAGWATVYPRLAKELKSGALPKGTSISVGTYGVNAQMADQLQQLRAAGANVHYTPAFSLVHPHHFVTGPDGKPQRVLDTNGLWAARAQGVQGDVAHAGPIPLYPSLKTNAERYAWGKELGQRFRDQLEAAKKKGVKVDGWMMDEIWGSAGKDAGGVGEEIRELMRGVLDGLSQGRAGQPPMKGLVYVANLGALVNAKQTPELMKFWASLDAATTQVVQEEYPIFGKGVVGARAVAENANRSDRKLAALGGPSAAISRKLVAGMAPGYKEGALHGQWSEDGHGGWRNLGLSPAQVAVWRRAYMDSRAQAGVAGFGEFGFTGGNTSAAVVNPLLDQVSAELTRLRRGG